MNTVTGYARPLPDGSFWAMVRVHRDGKPKPVLGESGAPITYPDEASALRVVVKHICAYFESPMYRDGVRIGDLSEADAAFPGLRPMVRNGRKVEVERKGRRA